METLIKKYCATCYYLKPDEKNEIRCTRDLVILKMSEGMNCHETEEEVQEEKILNRNW